MPATPRPAPRGFTLIELLVVLAIVGLVSAVALPVVLPALNERKIGEGARLLHAVLSGARDAAVRAGAPRGIRLLVDPIFNERFGTANQPPAGLGTPLASNRMISIEPGPDYSEGRVLHPTQFYPPPNNTVANPAWDSTGYYLRVATSGLTGTTYNPPTGWSYNVRQGDKIRFNDTGNYYTIAGPIGTAGNPSATNPERFIITSFNPAYPIANSPSWVPEYLNLTNGIDDDGDGWIDESCDGIDNDGDGVVDPGYDGIDNNGVNGIDEPAELFYNANGSTVFNEYEQEAFVGSQASSPPTNDAYTITRRPIVSPGSREISLPDGIVIDLTTWNASASTPGAIAPGTIVRPLLPERSRLPVDPYTGYVDIMISPNGQVVLPGVGGGGNFARTPIANSPFYHFWLAEREGVVPPLWGLTSSSTNPLLKTNPNSPTQTYLLPMPRGTPNYTDTVFLTGNRRLVTLYAKTGQLMTNTIETFNGNDTNAPYYAAQAGIKEAQ